MCGDTGHANLCGTDVSGSTSQSNVHSPSPSPSPDDWDLPGLLWVGFFALVGISILGNFLAWLWDVIAP